MTLRPIIDYLKRLWRSYLALTRCDHSNFSQGECQNCGKIYGDW